MVAVDIKSLRATHWYFQVSGLRIVGQSVKQVKGGVTVWPSHDVKSLKLLHFRASGNHDGEARRHRRWTAAIFRVSVAYIMLSVGIYVPIISRSLPGRTLAVHEGVT